MIKFWLFLLFYTGLPVLMGLAIMFGAAIQAVALSLNLRTQGIVNETEMELYLQKHAEVRIQIFAGMGLVTYGIGRGAYALSQLPQSP